MKTIHSPLSQRQIEERIRLHTLEDCYQNVYWNSKAQSQYYADIKGQKFWMYYRPARSFNIFRTYLKGTMTPEKKGTCIAYRFGKESFNTARTIVIMAILLYTGLRVYPVSRTVGLLFIGLTALAAVLSFVCLPAARRRLEEELHLILETSKPKVPVPNYTPEEARN